MKKDATVLHSRGDDVVPFTDSEEVVHSSVLPATARVEVGSDHRLADPEPLAAMLRACERAAATPNPLARTPPSFQNGEMPPPYLIYLTVRHARR